MADGLALYRLVVGEAWEDELGGAAVAREALIRLEPASSRSSAGLAEVHAAKAEGGARKRLR